MTTAPIPLTEDVLGTRQAKTMVMLSTEERLPMKIPAYVKSDSEISFLVRQPSSSAILINQPYIELQLRFTLSRLTDGQVPQTVPTWKSGRAAAKVFGRQMEGLPFLSKCVRTSVVTINGASNTFRNSEYFVPYLRSIVGRDAMAKIGTPWNDFEEQYQTNAYAASNSAWSIDPIMGRAASKQARLFDMSSTRDGAAANLQVRDTYIMTFREPLFFSVFNGLAGNSLWPVWCSEQNKSPSVLHAQQMSVNFNLHDNWAQNLFGMISLDNAGANTHHAKIETVHVDAAHLCCTFVQPPPKYIAASLSANVTYQTTKFMRFKAKASGVGGLTVLANHSNPDYALPNETVKWTLDAVNFQYMPSIFMIQVGPDYNEKANYIAPHNAANGEARLAALSKEDRRFGISALNLIVNTSPDIVPGRGSGDRGSEGAIQNLRYTSRELYEMYLKNCASVERAIYDFDTWFNRGCCVLISSADMNGILPSCHIRGNVSIQGSIESINTTGYRVYVGQNAGAVGVEGNAANPNVAFCRVHNANATDNVWIADVKFEKFECSVIGVYANSYMALDAKSGIVGESVMSEQYGNGMRLSTAQ